MQREVVWLPRMPSAQDQIISVLMKPTLQHMHLPSQSAFQDCGVILRKPHCALAPATSQDKQFKNGSTDATACRRTGSQNRYAQSVYFDFAADNDARRLVARGSKWTKVGIAYIL